MDILFNMHEGERPPDNFAVAGALYRTCKEYFYDLDPETIARMILQQCDCDRYKPDKGERGPE